MAGQLTIDSLKASTGVLATQNGMTGIAKAWVFFNGSTAAINGTAFNVSSVTKIGTGQYTVNFTTAMANTNYSAMVNARTSGAIVTANPAYEITNTTSAIYLITYASGSAADATYVAAAFFN